MSTPTLAEPRPATDAGRATPAVLRLSVALLVMTAGYVDAYGFVVLKAYVSFMSGNTTGSGLWLGRGDVAAAMPTLLSIGCFLLGVFTGTLTAVVRGLRPPRVALGATAVMVALSLLVGASADPSALLGIALLAYGMGILNTVVSRLGQLPVNVGFVTGTLHRIGEDLALAVARVPVPDPKGPGDTRVRRALGLLGIWAAFLVGAVLSGAATLRFGIGALLPPLLVLAALAVFCPFPGRAIEPIS